MLYTRNQAQEFFQSWRTASIEVLQHFDLPVYVGHKTRPWKRGHPIGVTEHYTAGISWRGTVNWLNGGSDNSSCHALIHDRRVKEAEHIFEQYELDFPVLCLLLADIDKGTWHATWSNGYNFGIENRNAGVLRGEQENWRWWPNRWKAKFPHEKLGKTPVSVNDMWWEPYTYGQVVANIHVCQMLYCLHDGDMDPRWFLPHQCISNGKFDTGMAFPLNDIRRAVFDQSSIEDLHWLHEFRADPMYMDDYDEEADAEFFKEMQERQGDRSEDDHIYDPEMPDADLQHLVDDGRWREGLPAVRRALNLLGYYVPASYSHVLDEATALAVWMFQMADRRLTVDKIPGRKTRQQLYGRLKQFGLHFGRD